MNRIDPLNELEQDHDVRTAIADVEAVKRREAELRNKTRLRRFKDTLIEWGRFSSYNGMSHFALADNRYTLTFWFLIVTSSFVAFVYLLYITMRQYLEYRTDIDINKIISLQVRSLHSFVLDAKRFSAGLRPNSVSGNNDLQRQSIQSFKSTQQSETTSTRKIDIRNKSKKKAL